MDALTVGQEPVVDGAQVLNDLTLDARLLTHFADSGHGDSFIVLNVALGQRPQGATTSIGPADKRHLDSGQVDAVGVGIIGAAHIAQHQAAGGCLRVAAAAVAFDLALGERAGDGPPPIILRGTAGIAFGCLAGDAVGVEDDSAITGDVGGAGFRRAGRCGRGARRVGRRAGWDSGGAWSGCAWSSGGAWNGSGTRSGCARDRGGAWGSSCVRIRSGTWDGSGANWGGGWAGGASGMRDGGGARSGLCGRSRRSRSTIRRGGWCAGRAGTTPTRRPAIPAGLGLAFTVHYPSILLVCRYKV